MRVLVGKKGRPQKAGERYPSGQRKEPIQPQTGSIAPALLVRIRRAVELGHADPKHGSQVGQLFLRRELSSVEAATAFRIGEIWGRFEGNNGLTRSARSPSYEMGARGTSSAELGPDAQARVEADREAWMTLQEDMAEQPRAVRTLVERLCVEDQAIAALDLIAIRPVLQTLARGFRAGTSKKARKRKKGATLIAVQAVHRGKAAKPVARAVDHDREAWIKAQRALCPGMSEEDLQKAYRFFAALREREALRAKGIC